MDEKEVLGMALKFVQSSCELAVEGNDGFIMDKLFDTPTISRHGKILLIQLGQFEVTLKATIRSTP